VVGLGVTLRSGCVGFGVAEPWYMVCRQAGGWWSVSVAVKVRRCYTFKEVHHRLHGTLSGENDTRVLRALFAAMHQQSEK